VTPVPALDRLQRKVEQACQKAGLAPETRKFVPHVTLARLNASSGSAVPFLQRTASLRLGPWPVEEFILYESYLHPEGAVYEPVSRYRLRGA
jgi:2'-5' RNA ligase